MARSSCGNFAPRRMGCGDHLDLKNSIGGPEAGRGVLLMDGFEQRGGGG